MRRFHPERGPTGPRSFFARRSRDKLIPLSTAAPESSAPSRSPTPFRHAREGGHPERTRTTIAGKWKGQGPPAPTFPSLAASQWPHRFLGDSLLAVPEEAVMSGDEQSKGGPMGGFGGKDGAGARSARRARPPISLVDIGHDRTRGAIEGAKIGS